MTDSPEERVKIATAESERLKDYLSSLPPHDATPVRKGLALDNSRLSPPETVRQNLWFINVFDQGQAKTEQERREWLSGAGFENIERKTFPDGRSIMVARKPG